MARLTSVTSYSSNVSQSDVVRLSAFIMDESPIKSCGGGALYHKATPIVLTLHNSLAPAPNRYQTKVRMFPAPDRKNRCRQHDLMMRGRRGLSQTSSYQVMSRI